MSKLGRRLVFVMLSLSLTLMGISLAVNATATDWKGKLKAQSDEKAKLSSRLELLSQAIEKEKLEIKDAKDLKDSQDKSYGTRINVLNTQILASRKAMDKTHADYQQAQIDLKNDVLVQEKETARLKQLEAQITALETQKALFDEQNQLLTDMVSQLEREVAELKRSSQILKAETGVTR